MEYAPEVQIPRAMQALDRIKGQMACSTPRRQTFTITRDEAEALVALRKALRTGGI